MSVHAKKLLTTPNVTDSTQEQSTPMLPDQQQFQQHLRELAHNGIRSMLEAVMREELMRSSAWVGERAALSATAIATAPTPVTC